MHKYKELTDNTIVQSLETLRELGLNHKNSEIIFNYLFELSQILSEYYQLQTNTKN